MIQKFTISRDDSIYEAWPDVALTPSGRLLCVFSECTHHADRSYTRIMLTDSRDRGRTWTPKRPLTEPTHGLSAFWNCARIACLRDGRMVVLVDKSLKEEGHDRPKQNRNYLFFSEDEGRTWTGPVDTPALGIVPDKLLELEDGRWILCCHREGTQRLWYSDDRGASWNGPSIVACREGLQLCEASILPVDDAPNGQIRGYSVQMSDFILPGETAGQ